MTILGRGDLVPRRRQRRRGRAAAAVLVVAAVAAGGYLGYRHFHGSGSTPARRATPVVSRTCPPPVPGLDARSISLQVRNGSLRTGLAARVARQLRRHQFRVGSVGNAAAVDRQPATIRYTPDQQTAASTLARYVPGARLATAAGHNRLELELGTTFRALAPAAAMRQADRLRSQVRIAPSGCPAAGS